MKKPLRLKKTFLKRSGCLVYYSLPLLHTSYPLPSSPMSVQDSLPLRSEVEQYLWDVLWCRIIIVIDI